MRISAINASMATTGERSSGPRAGRIRRKIRRYGSQTSRRKSEIRRTQTV